MILKCFIDEEYFPDEKRYHIQHIHTPIKIEIRLVKEMYSY
jgi:hypothetical protein